MRGHQNLQEEKSNNRLLHHPWTPACHRQVWKVPRSHYNRRPLMECPCRPSYKEGRKQLSIPEKKPAQLPEPYQSADLPNQGPDLHQPGIPTQIATSTIWKPSSAVLLDCYWGLPHYKQRI